MSVKDVMRRYREAADKLDFELAFSCLDADVVVHVPGRSPMAGTLHGRDAAIDYIQKAGMLVTSPGVEVDVIDELVGDDRFALIVRRTFQRPGGDVEINRANVYRVERERIVELWIYEANQYEVDELFGGASDG